MAGSRSACRSWVQPDPPNLRRPNPPNRCRHLVLHQSLANPTFATPTPPSWTLVGTCDSMHFEASAPW
jgi:hypothetical protein